MKVDVLILFEAWNREMENCCLLSAELENRGYKVRIESIYSPLKYLIKAKIILTPHLYDEVQLILFCKNIWGGHTKIIDLQYEQILRKNVSNDDIHNPKGQAQYAHHIAWGEAQAERYLNNGIEEANIHIVGSISMDFLRSNFDYYFYTRDYLAKKYGLDSSSEWIMFVSSFSYCNLSEKRLNNLLTLNKNAKEFAEISEKSQTEILQWFKDALQLHPNKLFIYRPHPAEIISEQVYEIEKQYKNFRIIADYSMRQWVKVVDRFYNWYSTSIADIYYARKTCFILRPIEIEDNAEVAIMDGVQTISSREDFLTSVDSSQHFFPVSSKVIEYYYGSGDGQMAYSNIADLVVQLLNDEIKGYPFKYGNRFNIYNDTTLFKIIKGWIDFSLRCLCILFRIRKSIFFKSKQRFFDLMVQSVYGKRKDINQLKSRIKSILLHL